jgi:hypothetical protein
MLRNRAVNLIMNSSHFNWHSLYAQFDPAIIEIDPYSHLHVLITWDHCYINIIKILCDALRVVSRFGENWKFRFVRVNSLQPDTQRLQTKATRCTTFIHVHVHACYMYHP